MAQSMTGFGAAEGPVGTRRLAVEARSVNHRHFSASFRLPAELQAMETELRNRLRARLERGHVTVAARWTTERESDESVAVDTAKARAVVHALHSLQAEFGLAGEIDMALVARQPGVLRSQAEEAPSVDEAGVYAVLEDAVAQLVATRAREGAALTAELLARLGEMDRLREAVAARAPERIVAQRDRLRVAVRELLDGRQIDESRLAVEIALLAEKLDVTEEVTRLETHCGAFREALDAGGPVGRQLGFLGQEMLREVNTIGSKANDADLTQIVIAMKGELDKVREQVENLE